MSKQTFYDKLKHGELVGEVEKLLPDWHRWYDSVEQAAADLGIELENRE